MKNLKIFPAILLAVLLLTEKSFAQNQSQATKSKPEFWSKLVHNTEMGFLLGEQAAINNNYNPIYSYDMSKMASSIYPYPYYYGDDRYSNFTFQHFTGYPVHKAINMGLTAGFDYYRSNIITPVSVSVKSTLVPSKRISPIGSLDVGYGFIWKSEADKVNNIDKYGGLMINPSAGFRIKVGNDGSNLNINVGYKLQQSGFENNRPDEKFYLTEKRSFNRLSIRLGFGF
ncbi:MAG: hypothetical protein V4683_12840 [Bacteroidota bacterium]